MDDLKPRTLKELKDKWPDSHMWVCGICPYPSPIARSPKGVRCGDCGSPAHPPSPSNRIAPKGRFTGMLEQIDAEHFKRLWPSMRQIEIKESD